MEVCYQRVVQIHLFSYYHFLHDQYLAFVRGPGLSQLCLARNERLRAGLDFLIFILGSPKLTFLVLPVLGSLTYTLNFLTSPRIGLPSGTLRPWYSASSISSSSLNHITPYSKKKSSPSYVSSIISSPNDVEISISKSS